MKTLLALLFSTSVWLHANGLPTSPYIYVQGHAREERKADLVTIRFSLSAAALEAATANKTVQTQANKAFALLKETGVAEADVIANDVRSDAEYSEPADGQKPKFLGYRVSRPFIVKLRDLTKLPNLMDALVEMKLATVDGFTEGLEKEKELTDAVWEKAIKDARERAEKIAKASGQQIDSVFATSPVAFPEISAGIFGTASGLGAMSVEPVGAGPAEHKVKAEYRLAPITVDQSVHMIFLVSPAK